MEPPNAGLADLFADTEKVIANTTRWSQITQFQHIKDLTRFNNFAAYVGGLALLSIVGAFFLMIAFAIKNAALL